MPRKNPSCPKCNALAGHGATKQIKFLEVHSKNEWGDMEYGKVIYKCNHCGFEFEGFGSRRVKRRGQENDASNLCLS